LNRRLEICWFEPSGVEWVHLRIPSRDEVPALSVVLSVRAVMKYGLGSILILASVIGALASPTQNVLSFSRPRPLVIWHGLGASAPKSVSLKSVVRMLMGQPIHSTGDSYDSPGILKFQSAVEEIHPGIYIHSIYVDPDSKSDQQATIVRSEFFSSTTFVGLRLSV